jgi:hypothetical protein
LYGIFDAPFSPCLFFVLLKIKINLSPGKERERERGDDDKPQSELSLHFDSIYSALNSPQLKLLCSVRGE